MSPKKFDAQEWGRRLESGEQDEPTLSLAARLEKSRPDPRPLPPAFREALRARLLNRRIRYPIGQWALSAVGLFVLAAAVFFFWSSLAHWQQPIQPGAAGPEAQPAITGQATATPTPIGGEIEITSESDGVTTVILPPTPFPPTLAPPHESEEIGVGFVEVDLWQSTAVSHPQVDGRFNLTLAEAQEQVAYPLQAPTLLPAGFPFVGAAVAVIYPNEPLEPGVGMIFAAAEGAAQGPILNFHQHPVLAGVPNFDAHEYAETHLTIRPVALGDFVGDYQLDDRAGRATLRWQAAGFRYTLTMSGELAPVEVLVQIATSLQANSQWLALPDQLWFIAVSPEPGAILNEGDTVTVTIGYELNSAEEGIVYLQLVDSEWEKNSAWLTSQPVTAVNREVQLHFTVEDIAFLQAKAGQTPLLQAVMSTSDAQRQHKELMTALLDDSPWQLGQTMIGIPRIRPEMEVTILSGESSATTHLEIVDIAASAATAQGMTPITFTVQLAYGLSARQAEEASLMIWMIPEGGGVSQVVAATAVPAGRGNLTATFTFNPLRDLGVNLRQPQRYQLRLTINKTDGSERPELTAITLPLEWTFEP